MKLIIDIPEVDYELAKQRWMKENDAHKMDYYISKGIPLDDVKAEIDKAYEDVTMYSCDEQVSCFASKVQGILDKKGD